MKSLLFSLSFVFAGFGFQAAAEDCPCHGPNVECNCAEDCGCECEECHK